ncbi:MAG: MarR family transcriptional regulator [Lachnospiraceae bacterium]|nr:MarR family transcriptional regulator [Lachnospiraceae bacterium]MCI7595678.1 MarR family transcriptional regulator [Lachnospiraceae bacterium]MDD7049332.1 MarR family transcriptional regulator [Lachnospiraceae bacterium]MDY3222955.1 MarR family transcriptional regulator [Lachnospiraceae bacterium]MDY4095633.1 MarR family transcriptional regulator [Lachnospiraceae bacterium]
MLRESFTRVYSKFKLHFYQKVFERWQDREASLTTVETFCMEIINAAGEPTVNEFAKLANLSSPNAAYKVNNLVKKGYLTKVQSREDKREYHLRVTQKYLDYYNISYQYMDTVLQRMEERFSPEELEILVRMLKVMDEELMSEIQI